MGYYSTKEKKNGVDTIFFGFYNREKPGAPKRPFAQIGPKLDFLQTQ